MTGLALFVLPAAGAVGLWLTRARAIRPRRAAAAIIHLQAALTVFMIWRGGQFPDAPGVWHLVTVNAVFLFAAWGLLLPGLLGGGNRDGETRFVWPELLILLAALNGLGLASSPLFYYLALESVLFAVWLILGTAALDDPALRRALVVYSLGTGLTLAGMALLGPGLFAPFAGLDALARSPIRAQVGVALAGTGLAVAMGLAPVQGWLPALARRLPWPAALTLVALLPGGALVGWLRLEAAGARAYGLGELLQVLGLASMAAALYGLAARREMKSFLAHIGVFHAGVAAFAVGLGGEGLWIGLMLGMGRAAAVTVLFLAGAGMAAGMAPVGLGSLRGVWRTRPFAGAAWLGAILSGCGLPPFPLFPPLFATAVWGFAAGATWQTGLFLALLAAGIMAIADPACRLLGGHGDDNTPEPGTDHLGGALAALAALALAVFLGLGVPETLGDILTRAAAAVDPAVGPPPGIQ